jgi:acyl-CoA synthetase (AMP-forming)/AMP-acid ligase II/acyl carrier protein
MLGGPNNRVLRDGLGLRSESSVVEHLRTFGDAPAVITDDTVVSYCELATAVEQRAARLGDVRRLVMLTGTSSVELVVTVLAALHGHHPLWLLAEPSTPQLRSLVERYDPDVIVAATRAGVDWEERRAGTRHGLHPELALLMSTSGSTGSSKLVRLSRENVESNAAAIAEYLCLTTDDRAITSLPPHYCYGLSVITSHVSVGASLVVTNNAVVDPCFWDAARRHGATNFAGVPQTFDLLDRVGFASIELPSLRFVTQAGGRMAPETVRRYAALGAARGWDLFVMYGQTEATARMAYLPPHLAHDHPGAIGVAIPGGSLTVRGRPELGLPPGTGEIVYRGPNVMLGYATSPGDLARGRTVSELVTGDIGRIDSAGLFEVVGRAARFVKISGIRIDLDEVERIVTARHGAALVAGDDVRLVVAITGDAERETVRTALARELAISRRAVDVRVTCELPRLPNGKPDYASLTTSLPDAASGGRSDSARSLLRRRRRLRDEQSIEEMYADVLAIDGVRPGDTFAALGGDSLSYVELSVRLEERLGSVPRDWHLTPVADLSSLQPRPRRVVVRVDTTVVLRALAIVMVVANHMKLYRIPGGAHVLLAVVGFNFARFQLAATSGRDLLRRSFASVGRVALPASLWIGAQMATVGGYSLGTVLLVNNYTGSSWRREGRWQYWFVEVLVQTFVVAAALLAIAPVRRLEQRHPFAFPIALLAPALLLRFEVLQLGDPYNYLYRTHTVVWLFLIGWAAHRARSVVPRLVVTAAVVASVPGFFHLGQREVTVIAGLALLTWVRRIPVPRPLNRLIGTIAASSMAIYLVHYQVWPPLRRLFIGEVALPLTIAVGVAASAGGSFLLGRMRRRGMRRHVERLQWPAGPTVSSAPDALATRPA